MILGRGPLPFRYLVFNKPFQVLCQFTQGNDAPAGQRRTLADYVKVPAVYPVGRLDFDSEGLLLLSNDGPWQQRLTNPKFEHPRTYWVQVGGRGNGFCISAAAARAQNSGLPQRARRKPTSLAIRTAAPRAADPLSQEIPTSWIEVTLTEGRNRQVRRMTAAIGLPTLRLVRVAIGGSWLRDLPAGEWRDLTRSELTKLNVR